MYKVCTEKETVAVFDTVLEAIAYCETFDYVRLNPDGTFSTLEVR